MSKHQGDSEPSAEAKDIYTQDQGEKLPPADPRGVGCDCPGDMNGDNARNESDVGPFVGCVLNGGGQGCECADVSQDVQINGGDIPRFVGEVFSGEPCQAVQQTIAFATSARVTVLMTNPPFGQIILNLSSNAPNDTMVQLDAPPYASGQPIQTHLLAIDLFGFHPMLGAVELHLNPAFPSLGHVDNVVAGGGGEFLSGDSFFGVFVRMEFPNAGTGAINRNPVPVQAIGIAQLDPPELPHVSGPINIPLVFDNPGMTGSIIDVVHNPEPVCIYEVTCIDGPCNDCGVALGDICIGARCPGGSCAMTVQTDCGAATCCVFWTFLACDLSVVPPCAFGGSFCPICDPTPGACCLPDGSCIVTTEADCKQQGGPMAYQGDGTACAPPQKCCLPDGSCIDTDPMCCALLGGTSFAGLCAPPQKCCFADGSCIDTDPMCCALLGGTSFAGLCAPEACCFPDGSCQNLDPDCCTLIGGTPDGPGFCIPPEKCCLPDDSCINADPLCCINVLMGTPFPGACEPIEACCFPDGTCQQLEPSCCINAGGTPDGVGPCLPIEACCLPDGSCIQAEPLCCISVFGGVPDGVGPCLPPEACCLPDGSCIQADPLCCTNVHGGTPDGVGPCLPLEACCLPDGSCIQADPLCCINVHGGIPDGVGPCLPIEACCLPDGTCIQAEPSCCINVFGGIPDGVGPCLAQEACCFTDGTCQMAEPLCCENVLGGEAQGPGSTCVPNMCPCAIQWVNPSANDVFLVGTEIDWVARLIEPSAVPLGNVTWSFAYTQGTGTPAAGAGFYMGIDRHFCSTVTSEGDVTMQVTASVLNGPSCMATLTIKTVKPEVVELSFLNDHALRHWVMDDMGNDITDPVWVKTFGGAVTEDEPAAYTRSTAATDSLMTAGIRLQAAFNLTNATAIRVQGVGVLLNDEDFEFDEATVQNWPSAAGLFELQSTPIQDVNGAYFNLDVEWEYVVQKKDGSWPDFSDAVQMNASSHLVFSTFAAPLEAPLFDLALDKICLEYADGENMAATIMSMGTTGVDNDICYDPAAIVGGHPLNIYPNNACLCANLADLLTLLARSTGIAAETRYFYGGNVVGTWRRFDNVAMNFSATMRTTAAGHDLARPMSHFTYHAQTRSGGTYYDPSYGTVGQAMSSHQCCQDAGGWAVPCVTETPFLEAGAFPGMQNLCPNDDPHGADPAAPGCP